ncbi:unnamed protein product [Agarophyton chilense]
MYLDARSFAKIPYYRRGSKNAHSDLGYNWLLNGPVDPRWATRYRTLIQVDMPYVRCGKEAEYQFSVNKLLSDIYKDFISPHVRFPPAGHNLLGLMCFGPPYDRQFWMFNRVFWNEMHEPDGRLRQSLEIFFCWHQVKFHEMSTAKLSPLYLSLSRVDENRWAM